MRRVRAWWEEFRFALAHMWFFALLPLYELHDRYWRKHRYWIDPETVGAFRNEAEVFFKQVQVNSRTGSIAGHKYEIGPFKAGHKEALFMADLLLKGRIDPDAELTVYIAALYFTRMTPEGLEVLALRINGPSDKHPLPDGLHSYNPSLVIRSGYPTVWVDWRPDIQSLQVWSELGTRNEYELGAYDIEVAQWRRGRHPNV